MELFPFFGLDKYFTGGASCPCTLATEETTEAGGEGLGWEGVDSLGTGTEVA